MFATTSIAFIACFLKGTSSDMLVQTRSGPIQGLLSSSENVEAFLGIPYAEPPVGDLRFAKPVPKKPWTKVLHASTLPPPCSQLSLGDFYYTPNLENMSEDCLYLNIWVPKVISETTLRPIIIFLYPGGFIFGGSNLNAYDGSNLAGRGDVIVATLNYRLGPFGYFVAYIEEANGSMGMYDQVAAIQWIKNNAIAFGGDPENIVLMGESAGAASIGAHMISPLSKTLFHKAIIQSGGILSPFFYDNNTRLFANSESVAFYTGCSNGTTNLKTNPLAVIRCLKHRPAEVIIGAARRILFGQGALFFPRTGDEFLPQSPAELIRQGKFSSDIPILTGINRDEGTMFITTGLPEYFGDYGQNSSSITKSFAALTVRSALVITKTINPPEIVNYYMSTVKNKSSVEYTKMIANVFGDLTVACSTIFQAEYLSKKGNPVYFYMFGFRSPTTPAAEWMGTTHYDEMQYVFGMPYHTDFTEEEIRLSNRLIDRWSAFAKTGDPNIPGEVPWIQYSHESPKYLSIDQEEEMIYKEPLERCKIWRTRFKAMID